jgi:hypothetical protein
MHRCTCLPVHCLGPIPVCALQHAHERVISIEDMTTSVELDYTDDSNIIVPSYTHQVGTTSRYSASLSRPYHATSVRLFRDRNRLPVASAGLSTAHLPPLQVGNSAAES